MFSCVLDVVGSHGSPRSSCWVKGHAYLSAMVTVILTPVCGISSDLVPRCIGADTRGLTSPDVDLGGEQLNTTGVLYVNDCNWK